MRYWTILLQHRINDHTNYTKFWCNKTCV